MFVIEFFFFFQKEVAGKVFVVTGANSGIGKEIVRKIFKTQVILLTT